MPKKFDFISPDIVLTEVDLSTLPPDTADDGLLIIGQAPQGPAMKPIRIRNQNALETVFGKTTSGQAQASDIWRAGNYSAPTYGLYAANAWLSTETSPVTYIRLAPEETGTGYTAHEAGWDLGGASASTTAADNRLAYGLWVCPSAAVNLTTNGTLAAIIYTKGAALTLSGTIAGTSDKTSSVGTLIKSDANGQFGSFALDVWTSNTISTQKKFDLTNIRSQLNTDPHTLVSGQKSATEKYFLGETFETQIYNLVESVSSSAGQQLAILMPLSSGSVGTKNWAERNRGVTASKTGYYVANHTGATGSYDTANLKKLFRFVSLHEGEHFQKNHYMEINLKSYEPLTSDYSSFTVNVKGIDQDPTDQPLESFVCDLDPNSPNFIAKRIGDQYLDYSSTKKKFITKGNYKSNSDYIRVELHDEYKSVPKNSIPFGFYGPYKPGDFTLTSGSAAVSDAGTGVYASNAHTGAVFGGHTGTGQFARFENDHSCSFSWPELEITDDNNISIGLKLNEAFGVRNYRSNATQTNSQELMFNTSDGSDYLDLIRNYQEDLDPHSSNNGLSVSFIVSLDDLEETSVGSGNFYFKTDSHKDGNSYVALNGVSQLINDAQGELRLVAPFFGGFDGVDVTQVDPFDKTLITGTTKTSANTAAIDKVIEFISDPEFIQYDVVGMPGIVKESLVRKLAQNTAKRADALAVIDVDSGFVGKHRNNGSNTLGTINSVVTQMETFKFNNSYVATYYPEIKIKDEDGGISIVPSSIAGIGAIAKSEAATGAPWFAPAGFNRGGISVLGGATGPVVVGPAETLTKAERDRLYQVNVNPIANFPGEGPVVFGQKTLQKTRSALDRINVRRLMIYLKKRIGAVARGVLFDPNLQTTWNRFTSGANPILADAKANFGIAEYKLVLDSSTTTPDLIDRNIMYAQIYIRPAYAIEFIAIDFKITRTGIEF